MEREADTRDISLDEADIDTGTDIGRARFNMIHQQIRPWGVLDDRVLAAMGGLPREVFVPDAYRGLAYADLEIPLGQGQAMLAPKVVGRLLQALAVRPGDKVLEVGTGTGYVTACLLRLGARVVSLEIEAALAEDARGQIERLGVGRVEILAADALAGPAPGGPFDAIAMTGAVPTVAALAPLEAQLAPGGRLFAIVGACPVMEALLVTRAAFDELRREALFETCAPRLANAPEPEDFVF